ncbi:Cytoglobin-1 [Papilio machaon]|uniref:Cytoglobin-1 n=1 Tax=Papilio machaon TaxID=76193 RepID=A0A194QXE5_PAPMA|nr:Cytoglobin-1 [Papilio machaon]
MGGWLSHLWWGGDPDKVNHVSGLTRREIYAVQKSWAPVNKNSVATGTELLKSLLFQNYGAQFNEPIKAILFFRAYPNSKDFFKMISKLPEEEYSKNFQFKAHVINLMATLNQAVTNLNQPEVVAVMMNKLGESHKRRKIQEQHFNDLKEVIVKMFIEVLKLDDSTLGAWGKTVGFWYKHIFETLNTQEST